MNVLNAHYFFKSVKILFIDYLPARNIILNGLIVKKLK